MGGDLEPRDSCERDEYSRSSWLPHPLLLGSRMTSKLRDSRIGNLPCPKPSGDHGPLEFPMALDARLFGVMRLVYGVTNGIGTEVSLSPREWLGLLSEESGEA